MSEKKLLLPNQSDSKLIVSSEFNSTCKLPYSKPHIQYWPKDKLDAIEATLSSYWGGGVSRRYVYLVNTPDNLQNPALNLTGHAALMLENDKNINKLDLFNFAPHDDAATVGRGLIASAVEGPLTIYEFTSKCMANNREGICVSNGETSWNERFSRGICIGVNNERFEAIRDYANSIKENPPEYNFALYNCLTFCNEALASAGVVFTDYLGQPIYTIIPNDLYSKACSAKNVGYFRKFNF